MVSIVDQLHHGRQRRLAATMQTHYRYYWSPLFKISKFAKPPDTFERASYNLEFHFSWIFHQNWNNMVFVSKFIEKAQDLLRTLKGIRCYGLKYDKTRVPFSLQRNAGQTLNYSNIKLYQHYNNQAAQATITRQLQSYFTQSSANLWVPSALFRRQPSLETACLESTFCNVFPSKKQT